MLSTRNVGAKGDEESNFATSKNEVAEDDDSRGYHQTSYKRDGSRDYKRWLVYILTTAVAGYFLWSSLTSPKAQSLIELNTEKKFHAENPLIVRPLLQNQPDAMGCYHSVPEIDLGKHIVPPPSGPITLVCCQSTKGEISCRTRTVKLSQVCCFED